MQSATLTETTRTREQEIPVSNLQIKKSRSKSAPTHRNQRRPASPSSFGNSCPAATDEPCKCHFKASFVFLTSVLCSTGRFIVQSVPKDGFCMSGSTSTPQTHRFPRLRQEMNPAVEDSGTCSVSCAVTRDGQCFVFRDSRIIFLQTLSYIFEIQIN